MKHWREIEKCPICDSACEVKGALHEDGCVQCSEKHYYYQHSYGSHELHLSAWDGSINGDFGWHYTETARDAEVRNHAIDGFIDYVRSLK